MAEQRIKTIFQIRRGLSKDWWNTNPVLRAGEPGMAIDTLEIKWGDGTTPWRNLLSTNVEYNFDAPTVDEFPAVGSPDVIYRASEERILYQWNESLKEYEPLSCGAVEASNLLIDIIDGGNANV